MHDRVCGRCFSGVSSFMVLIETAIIDRLLYTGGRTVLQNRASVRPRTTSATTSSPTRRNTNQPPLTRICCTISRVEVTRREITPTFPQNGTNEFCASVSFRQLWLFQCGKMRSGGKPIHHWTAGRNWGGAPVTFRAHVFSPTEAVCMQPCQRENRVQVEDLCQGRGRQRHPPKPQCQFRSLCVMWAGVGCTQT